MLGIDLGNEYAVVAAFTATGPRVLGGAAARVPNCVAVTLDGDILAGEAAVKHQAIDAAGVCSGFTRKLGDATVRYALNGKELTPVDCAAAVIRLLAARAKDEIGEEAVAAPVVVAVPAWYNDTQRMAVKTATEAAGLMVRWLVNEPSAAALFWAFQHPGEDKRKVMVLSLGERHFDVSVLTLTETHFEVLATNGLINQNLAGIASGGDLFAKMYPPIREALKAAQAELAQGLDAILLSGDLRHKDELCAQLKGLYQLEAVTPGEPAHVIALGSAVYAKIAPQHQVVLPHEGSSQGGCLVMLAATLATAAAAGAWWV